MQTEDKLEARKFQRTDFYSLPRNKTRVRLKRSIKGSESYGFEDGVVKPLLVKTWVGLLKNH